MSKTINIGIGYGDIAFFHLRAITIAEETAFTAKFADLDKNLEAEAKAAAETEIYIDAIASWSELAPTKKIADPDNKGKQIEVPYFDENETFVADKDSSASAMVRRYFEQGDFDAERVAATLIAAYRSRLEPTVVFQ